jgi:indole-3-glycerol phosphate synthase
MNILDDIVASKRAEIASRKALQSLDKLKISSRFGEATRSLKHALRDPAKSGIIAEFKRKSPSRGIINALADLDSVTSAYVRLGASALSILTDGPYFGGSTADLAQVRRHPIPILRKDFIVDEYQVWESRAMGADAILLIAAALLPEEVARLAALAKSLDLEVLLEIHHDGELGHVCADVDLVGVNNRDLKTFAVDVRRSEELAGRIPVGPLRISESGISDPDSICRLKTLGYEGFLIGEYFMKEADPAIAFASFVNRLKKAVNESKSLRHDPA